MKISVVIPAWNALSTLEACLCSLDAQSLKPAEVIVVDDSSDDGTGNLAEKHGARVLDTGGRMGPAVARNQGADSVTGDVIVFLDADVTVPPDLLRSISDILTSFPDAAAVQTLYTAVCPASDIVSRYQNYYYHYGLNRLREEYVAIFATWCVAVRTDDFRAVGGFNTSIPEPTVEDEELGYTLADRGRLIFLAKDLQVNHLASYSMRQFARRRFRMAKAQAKSGWRSFRMRLLKRYINIRETGTHHSRGVVLSIAITLLGTAGLVASPVAGSSASLMAFSSLGLLSVAMLCHWDYFRRSVTLFGWRILPGFIFLCLLDMLVLGAGIVTGTLQYLAGRHY